MSCYRNVLLSHVKHILQNLHISRNLDIYICYNETFKKTNTILMLLILLATRTLPVKSRLQFALQDMLPITRTVSVSSVLQELQTQTCWRRCRRTGSVRSTWTTRTWLRTHWSWTTRASPCCTPRIDRAALCRGIRPTNGPGAKG